MTDTSVEIKKPRKRYSPSERRGMILDGAIELFSENGFDASTHQLAERLGVSQPLIYNYFPTKDDLIEAVYQRLFKGRWKAEWDGVLSDRTRPIEDRLIEFYTRYCEVIHSRDWMRIFLYAGLKSLDLNRRYAPIVEEHAIQRICIELRHSFNLPHPDRVPISHEEFEAVWAMHSGIFYYGVRRYVYKLPVEADVDELIRGAVLTLLGGMPELVERLELEKA